MGHTIVVGNAGFHNGIIRFADPSTTLATDTNASTSSQQAITFAIDDATPILTTPASVVLPLGKKKVILAGTASAPIGIQRVEVKRPGADFAAARGLEQWKFPARLTKKRTALVVRAVSASGKVSAPTRVVVRRQ